MPIHEYIARVVLNVDNKSKINKDAIIKEQRKSVD